MPRPTIQEATEQAQEFFKSWRQREEVVGFERWLESPAGRAAAEAARQAQQFFRSSATWRGISEQMRQRVEPAAEIEPKPVPKRNRHGRPYKLTPEKIEEGISLLRSHPNKMSYRKAYAFLRRKLKLSRGDASDSALRRSIVSKVYIRVSK
jgi:hypothetical protein